MSQCSGRRASGVWQYLDQLLLRLVRPSTQTHSRHAMLGCFANTHKWFTGQPPRNNLADQESTIITRRPPGNDVGRFSRIASLRSRYKALCIPRRRPSCSPGAAGVISPSPGDWMSQQDRWQQKWPALRTMEPSARLASSRQATAPLNGVDSEAPCPRTQRTTCSNP